MDISGRTIWQQAAGDTDRDYSDLCRRWDVILVGPGQAGPWPGCIDQLRADGRSARKLTSMRRFAEEMQEGDLVVLRSGTTHVLGVGEVVGGYEWSEAFGDVDGWDLEHVRRTRWLWWGHDGPRTFQAYSLKLGDTTQRLDNGVVRDWLADLSVSADAWQRPLADLPASSDDGSITIEQVSDIMFDHGVASASIEALLSQVGELTRIAKWYQRFGKPSEHETVAYLVVPLLRALGWTPQRMAVEWNRVDLALFDSLPRRDDSLRVVVEAKKMDRSCLTAVSQARSYADGKFRCDRLIVTEGIRYGVFVRDGHDFRLHAYMNLSRFRTGYPVYGCGGVEDALMAITPEWAT